MLLKLWLGVGLWVTGVGVGSFSLTMLKLRSLGPEESPKLARHNWWPVLIAGLALILAGSISLLVMKWYLGLIALPLGYITATRLLTVLWLIVLRSVIGPGRTDGGGEVDFATAEPSAVASQLRSMPWWRELDKDAIARLVNCFGSNTGQLANLVSLCNRHGIVKKVAVLRIEGGEETLSLITNLLYLLGRNHMERLSTTPDPKARQLLLAETYVAFWSVLLIDKYHLPSYFALALQDARLNLPEKALEWCVKYREMEAELTAAPNEGLFPHQRALRDNVLNPRETADAVRYGSLREFGELLKTTPDEGLFPVLSSMKYDLLNSQGAFGDDSSSLRDGVDELEAAIRNAMTGQGSQ